MKKIAKAAEWGGRKMEHTQEIRRIAREEPEYPNRLKLIPDPPEYLYVRGKLPEESIPSVAIIGARDCSEYGKKVAAWLGRRMGEAGIQVISGMARGIDGISQEAALDAGGSSFGVLGCGVDICYPRQNRNLYEKLCAHGGVLSEYVPGTPPKPQNFPPRNRIVSGLADAVVVVEARARSGTLITVDMALEQGREVYVVPGRVTDNLSAGCNRLMKTGAGILLDTEEFLEELEELHRRTGGMEATEKLKKQVKLLQKERTSGGMENGTSESLKELSPECAAIFKVLDFYPQSLEQIKEQLPKKYREKQINTHLMRLCMEKLAIQVSPGFFCKNKS